MSNTTEDRIYNILEEFESNNREQYNLKHPFPALRPLVKAILSTIWILVEDDSKFDKDIEYLILTKNGNREIRWGKSLNSYMAMGDRWFTHYYRITNSDGTPQRSNSNQG